MAKAHFVKKARKDNPVVKKGESYWWWSFRTGGRFGAKQYSKTQPTRSQLTQSPYLKQIYDMVDNIDRYISSFDNLEDGLQELTNAIEELRDEVQSSLDNMPEQFQDGDSGQLMQERIDACENASSSLESIEIPSEPDDWSEEIDGWNNIDESDREQQKENWKDEKYNEVREEVEGIVADLDQ